MPSSNLVKQDIRRIREEFNKFSRMTIHIGIQGSDYNPPYDDKGNVKDADAPHDEVHMATIATIARVHEYGMVIHAKNVKNLAIPMCKKARNKSPRSFPDLEIVYTREAGGAIKNKFLAKKIKSGKKKGEMEFYYWLTPEVTVPERSFIRGSYHSHKNDIQKICKKSLQKVLKGECTADEAAKDIGIRCVGIVKRYMTTVKSKGDVTLASAPNKTTPLIQSGMLRNYVTYVVEGSD